jgi:hypothetical protein
MRKRCTKVETAVKTLAGVVAAKADYQRGVDKIVATINA